MLSFAQHKEARELLAQYDAWAQQFKQLDGWTVIPADAIPPVAVSNKLRSAVELYEWHTDPPSSYWLYINESKRVATTWTGDVLGSVTFGCPYRSVFGDTRVPITVHGSNGIRYYGVYYKSTGDYARIRAYKHQTKRAA